MRLDLNWMKFRPFGPKSDVWGPLAFFAFAVFCLFSLFLCAVVAMSGYVWVVSGYLVVPQLDSNLSLLDAKGSPLAFVWHADWLTMNRNLLHWQASYNQAASELNYWRHSIQIKHH